LADFEIEGRFCRNKKQSLCSLYLDRLEREFEEFFKKAIGNLRGIQKFWARRIFFKESFAAVAPTGIGKTSFGLVMALFLARKGKKSYLIFPTTLLVNQAVEKIEEYSRKLGIDVKFNEIGEITVAYYQKMLTEFCNCLDSTKPKRDGRVKQRES